MHGPASRRTAWAVLVLTVVLCALAPMNGVSFALAGLTAFSLKQLPRRARLLVIAASLGIVVIGTFEVVTNGFRTVTVEQPQTPGSP